MRVDRHLERALTDGQLASEKSIVVICSSEVRRLDAISGRPHHAHNRRNSWPVPAWRSRDRRRDILDRAGDALARTHATIRTTTGGEAGHSSPLPDRRGGELRD